MASPMITLDDEIRIEVVRKEGEAEPREVPVYFKVDGYTTASILYPKYHKIFNWQDVEEGDCTELLRSLEEISNLVLDNPSCSTHYPDPESGIDISIWVTDPIYEVYLDMAGDMEHVSLFIREWTDEGFTYTPLYTGKICGYDNLDIFKKGDDIDHTLPTEVMLPLNSKQEFKVYLGNTRAIDFELETTKDGGINCNNVFGIGGWCTRTTAPKVGISDNSVNLLIDPIAITKEEILATSQDRGKIDVKKLPPALQSGTCGWTFQGDGVAPLGSLSSDTRLRYTAPWRLYDQTSIPPLTYTIDLAYGNPPTNVAAINLHHACDGSLPCAPIIHASLYELPIVKEEEGTVRITATSQIPLYYSDDSNGPQKIPCSSRVVWDQDNQICDARYEADACWEGAHVISSLTFPYSSSGIVTKYLSEGSMYDNRYNGSVTANYDHSTLHITLTEYPTVDIEGVIVLPTSIIPTTIYQQTPSAFMMQVMNIGTVASEYQVAITFEGIGIQNEEVFWSDWSADVAPNESIMLPLSVELSEEAIPVGIEIAEYNILTRLVAR